jgi:hypothetical protein
VINELGYGNLMREKQLKCSCSSILSFVLKALKSVVLLLIAIASYCDLGVEVNLLLEAVLQSLKVEVSLVDSVLLYQKLAYIRLKHK